MSEHQQMQQSKESKPSFQKQATPTIQTPISSPASIIQRARINPKSLTAADVLQLQRTIGNRAVGRLLSEIRNPSKVQQVPIQRQTVPEEEKEPLQGMFGKKLDEETCPSCMQRQESPEEEEPLQGKMIEPVQRQTILEEEEKPLQRKMVEPFQLQTVPEEEEKLQMKPVMQRQEKLDEDEPIQRKMIGTVQRQEIPEKEKSLQKKRENNTGMPDDLKVGVERLSRIDMSDVRVHHNSDKPVKIGALAYTQGIDIHVAPGQERHLPHEAWHVVQQKQGRVKPIIKLKGVAVNNDKDMERDADVMGVRANSIQSPAVKQRFAKRTIQLTSFSDILQARFYEKTRAGYVWWLRPISWVGGTHLWKPWIDPATGVQETHNDYGVWFQLDKAHTQRQKVKGTRVHNGNTTGIVLNLGGGPRPNWPNAMSGPGSADNVRNALAGVPHSRRMTSWGHQLAHKWGGQFQQWNAASVTNSGIQGKNAQEDYQSAVEDAVTHVSQNVVPPLGATLPLNSFRLKHTAYLYPGTHVAKYMRIKIYRDLGGGSIVKLIDQVTPDFAKKLSTQQFKIQLIQQIARQGALLTKKTTDPSIVNSVNVVNGTP